MQAERDIRGAALRFGPLVAAAAVLIWHSLQYDFVTDDAFISFVYSRNFAHDNSLVFNAGDPVEGYTNFLWTFVLGLLMKIGLAPEIMSRVLGTAFAIGTLYVVFRAVEHALGRGSKWAYLAPSLLALSSGYACWSSGGLETQMFTFFVAAAVYAYARADGEQRWYRWCGALLALAAMTRPEGLLVTGLIGVHRLVVNLARDRRLALTPGELSCLAWFFGLWAPWFAWRWWYYGEFFPNTYYVKAAGDVRFKGDFQATMWKHGFHYVWVWARQTGAVWVSPLIGLGLVAARPHDKRFVLGTVSLLIGLTYLVYTARVGGDFMGLHRFIMPVFVLAALGLTLGLATACGWLPDTGRTRAIAGGAVGAVVVAAFAVGQYRLTVESLRWGNWKSDQGIDTPAFLWVYTHDRAAVGKHMESCFRYDDFAVFGGVGAQPFYSNVRGVDGFGLVSWDVAHCQPRTNPRAGHTKWADGALLAKQPRRDGHVCPPRNAAGNYDWSQVDGGPPEFWFARYALHPDPHKVTNWAGAGPYGGVYRQVTIHIGCTDARHTGHPPGWTPATPEPLQHGVFYTFFVRQDRYESFAANCKGLVE